MSDEPTKDNGPSLVGRTFRNGEEVLWTHEHPREWWRDRESVEIYVRFCQDLQLLEGLDT